MLSGKSLWYGDIHLNQAPFSARDFLPVLTDETACYIRVEA